MFELGAKGSWISQQFMVLKITGCLTIGKNVTDNVEALLDMVVANVPAPKVSEFLQMLITSLDFQLLQVVSIGR
jgi:predicted membrane GTPase involved in stress response